MKSSWGGLLIGILGLAVLDGVVSRQTASNNVAGFLSGAGGAVRRFLDPTVPLFSAAPATNTAAGTAAAGVPPTTTATFGSSAATGSSTTLDLLHPVTAMHPSTATVPVPTSPISVLV